MTALITAADLGIDTTTDQGLFDWLLASLLFGRPVPQQAAASAYRKFKQDGWDTPDHFTADDRHPLWHELWEGDYHRMSSVMSEELRDVMRALIADYGGSVARLVRTAGTRAEVDERLRRFKGVGPKTAEIFLREVSDAQIGSVLLRPAGRRPSRPPSADRRGDLHRAHGRAALATLASSSAMFCRVTNAGCPGSIRQLSFRSPRSTVSKPNSS
jgi:hypothetical protein